LNNATDFFDSFKQSKPLANLSDSPYHGDVAVRKTSSGKGRPGTRKTPKKSPGGKFLAVLFWVIFFILIIGLFLVNRELIQRTLRDTRLFDRLSSRNRQEEPEIPPVQPPPPLPPAVVPLPPVTAPVPPREPEETSRLPETPPAATDRPPANPPPPAAPPAADPPAPVQDAAGRRDPPKTETADRNRTVYFTQVDREGAILRSGVTRNIPASDSPMLDALNILLQGPTGEEQRRGLVSLVPPGTRILSDMVRGNNAYISFSEEFQ
jgi:hypothetical protein